MVICYKAKVRIWNPEVEPTLSNLYEGCQMPRQHAKYSDEILAQGLEVLSEHEMS